MRELTGKEASLLASQAKPPETPGERELRSQYERSERDRPAAQLACQLGNIFIIFGLLVAIASLFAQNWIVAAASGSLLQFGVLLLILGTLQAIHRRLR